MSCGRVCGISVLFLVAATGCATATAVERSAESAPALASHGDVRWIGIGGGTDPETTQVSLEQDVELARRVLGRDGLILFAGGPGRYGMHVLSPTPGQRTLMRRLGDLLDPRDARDSSYVKVEIGLAAATRDNALAAIEGALRAPGAPLLVFIATHGDVGDVPRDDVVELWGAHNLSVADLAEALDTHPAEQPVRFVIASCYSGGFGNLAFADADPARGAAPTPRCGLFASEWDRVASGCDPNPDRRLQDNYALHFLHALRGEDRSGSPLPRSEIDFDGDGRISLLEAHTRVRIASGSIDVPTATDERWLRERAPAHGAEKAVALPEEDAVIAAMSARLELRGEAAARKAQAKLHRRLAAAEDDLQSADDEENARFQALRMALLERWPVLDDPWNPVFPKVIEHSGKRIERFLDRAPQARAHAAAQRELERAGDVVDDLLVRRAALERLVRAYDNRHLAARLHAAGGPDWDYYQQLLACERGRP